MTKERKSSTSDIVDIWIRWEQLNLICKSGFFDLLQAKDHLVDKIHRGTTIIKIMIADNQSLIYDLWFIIII